MLCRLFLSLWLALSFIGGEASAQTSLTQAAVITQPQPSLNLNFTGCPAAIDSRISFTRALNTATYFGSDLLLHTANANVPRLEFNRATGACLGFLIEAAPTTNLALWNRDLTQAATWISTNVTELLNQVGIDGAANSASNLGASGANGTSLQTVTHASSTDTYSVYIKRKNGTGEIDLTLNGGTNWTAANSSICTYGKTASNLLTTDYVRCAITATVTNPSFGIRIVTSGDVVAVDYNQLEVLGFATSPIATTTVGVLRNADVATILASSFGFAAGQPGTVQTNLLLESQGAAIQVAGSPLGITGTSGADYITFTTGNHWGSFPGANFFDYGAIPAVTAAFSAPAKVAFAWDSVNRYMSVGGNSVVSEAVANYSVYNNPGSFVLGARSTSAAGPIYGWLQQVKYWPQRLPNQTLIQMTRPGQQ